MPHSLVEDGPRTLAVALLLLAIGVVGWWATRRQPAWRAAWTAAVIVVAGLAAYGWVGVLVVPDHGGLPRALLPRHLAALFLAALVAASLPWLPRSRTQRSRPAG